MKKLQLNEDIRNKNDDSKAWLTANADRVESPVDALMARLGKGDDTLGFFDDKSGDINIITSESDFDKLSGSEEFYAMRHETVQESGQLIDAD